MENSPLTILRNTVIDRETTIDALENILTTIQTSLDNSTKTQLKLLTNDISMLIENYFNTKGLK